MLYIVDARDEKAARKAGRIVGTLQVANVSRSAAIEGKAGSGGKLYANVIPSLTVKVDGQDVTVGGRKVSLFETRVSGDVSTKENIAFTV